MNALPLTIAREHTVKIAFKNINIYLTNELYWFQQIHFTGKYILGFWK